MARDAVQTSGKVNKDARQTTVGAAEQRWKRLVSRYQELVDKEFACGLTIEEASEMQRLGVEIDAEEASSVNELQQSLRADLPAAKG